MLFATINTFFLSFSLYEFLSEFCFKWIFFILSDNILACPSIKIFGIKTSIFLPTISDFKYPNKLTRLLVHCPMVHSPFSFEVAYKIKSGFSKSASIIFPCKFFSPCFLLSRWCWCSSFNFLVISSLFFLFHKISFKNLQYNWIIPWFSESIFFDFNSLSHKLFISFKYKFNFWPKLYNLIVFKLFVTFVAKIPQNSPYNLVLFSIKYFNLLYFWERASISCSKLFDSFESEIWFLIFFISWDNTYVIKFSKCVFALFWTKEIFVLTELRLNLLLKLNWIKYSINLGEEGNLFIPKLK